MCTLPGYLVTRVEGSPSEGSHRQGCVVDREVQLPR